MSQRNPMNERYNSDTKRGVTRKSAASAKPKSKAAGTVTVGTKKKTPAERKAAQKAARKAEQDRQRELDKKYYKPDTERYKKLRRTWWLALIGAVVCVCASWALRGVQPDWLAIVALFLAYGLIIFAFYIDFSKIRKERRAYQERMAALEAKDEKQAKREGQKGQKGAAADDDVPSEDNKPVVKSRRGLGARRKKAEAAEAAKQAKAAADAGADGAADADEADGADDGKAPDKAVAS